jgi:hypothetical protein
MTATCSFYDFPKLLDSPDIFNASALLVELYANENITDYTVFDVIAEKLASMPNLTLLHLGQMEPDYLDELLYSLEEHTLEKLTSFTVESSLEANNLRCLAKFAPRLHSIKTPLLFHDSLDEAFFSALGEAYFPELTCFEMLYAEDCDSTFCSCDSLRKLLLYMPKLNSVNGLLQWESDAEFYKFMKKNV